MPGGNRWVWSLLLLPVLMTHAAAAQEKAGPGAFSAETWRLAPTRGPHWSREAVIEAFEAHTDFDEMTRPRIIAALGRPGFEADSYGVGTGRDSRTALWRLSAANDSSYRVDYDALDRVADHEILRDHPCGCEVCAAGLPVVRMTDVEHLAQSNDPANSDHRLSLAEFAARLGQRGQRSSDESRAGGQTWVYYSEVWRDAADRRRFLIASGHRPKRDVGEASIDAQPIDGYDVITLMPQCVAH